MSFRFLVIFVAGCFSALINATSKPNYELNFSNVQANGVPVKTDQNSFNCSDQIYSIIDADNLTDQPVNATIIWRNPSGQIQERTPVSLFPVEGKAFGWAWLKLHKATGAALLSFFDNSIGMDEFIGDWNIELQIDNQKVASGKFNVLC